MADLYDPNLLGSAPAQVPNAPQGGDVQFAEDLTNAALGMPTSTGFQQAYRQRQQVGQLNQYRQQYAGGQQDWWSRFVEPLSGGLTSAIRSWRASSAQQRLQQGSASDEDLQRIAESEELNKRDANLSTLESGYRGIAGIPATIVETYLGGWALKGLGAAGALSRIGGLGGALTRWGVQMAPLVAAQTVEGAGQRAFASGTAPTDMAQLGTGRLPGHSQCCGLRGSGQYRPGSQSSRRWRLLTA